MMRKYRNYKRCGVVLMMLALACTLCGCADSRESTVLIGRAAENAAVTQGDEALSDAGSENAVKQAPSGSDATEQSMFGTDAAEQESPGGNAAQESDHGEIQQIYVYVCGAVNSPGVVSLEPGSRIEAALEAAGGFAQEADREYVNLAAWVEDGARIYFPTEEEAKTLTADGAAGMQSGQNASGTAAADGAESEKVNLNTASLSVLCTLPGIGEARALDIIAYRESNGGFQAEEDIMEVSGIKTAVYEKIKDKITVR